MLVLQNRSYKKYGQELLSVIRGHPSPSFIPWIQHTQISWSTAEIKFHLWNLSSHLQSLKFEQMPHD